MKRILAVIAIAIALSAGATKASAVTVAELQAQIAMLMAQLQTLSGGSVTTGYSFNNNLTVGSTGSDVSALQDWLVSKGFLSMPAGVSKGYFGQLTKSAVVTYQTSVGLPSTGFVGPMTRGKLNAGGVVVTPGTTPTPSTPGITTIGAEGTLSASQSNANVASTIYENDKKVSVLGVKLEAKSSDINVQRVKLSLGTDSKIYNKIFSRIYVTDGSSVLGSSDLNSSTVVKDGSNYYITVTGMNLIIPKGESKTILIAVDVFPTIDSTDIDTETYPIALATDGVRGVDGAGIDQYAGSTSITRTPNISSDLADSATLTLSLNTTSPKASDVVATAGSSENEIDRLPLLVFDMKAEKDNVKVTDIRIGVVKSGSGAATAQTAYLYDGSGRELDNATISGGIATFNDFDYTINRDSTQTFVVKADIRNANSVDARFVATASTTVSADLVSENGRGDSITESGSATGRSVGVRNVGAEVSLVSKTITTSGAPQTSGANNIATSSLTANFVVRVKAVGGPLQFGTAASTTPMFTSTPTTFKVYKNSVEYSSISSYATSTDYTNPSGLAVTNSTFTLPEGQTVEIPVTFKILGRSALLPLTDGIYSVGLEGVQPNAPYAATFMAADADWRTTGVAFP